MTEVLIATDADAVFAEVEAALVDESTSVVRVRTGQAVAGVVAESTPDLVVLDLQIGNMGGIATCLAPPPRGRRRPAPRGAGADAPRPPGRRVPRQALRRRRLGGQAARRLLAASRPPPRSSRARATATAEQELVGDVNPAVARGHRGWTTLGGRPLLSTLHHGWWLSLVERCVRDAEVGSSNLPHPTSEAAGHPPAVNRLYRSGARAAGPAQTGTWRALNTPTR